MQYSAMHCSLALRAKGLKPQVMRLLTPPLRAGLTHPARWALALHFLLLTVSVYCTSPIVSVYAPALRGARTVSEKSA